MILYATEDNTYAEGPFVVFSLYLDPSDGITDYMYITDSDTYSEGGSGFGWRIL